MSMTLRAILARGFALSSVRRPWTPASTGSINFRLPARQVLARGIMVEFDSEPRMQPRLAGPRRGLRSARRSGSQCGRPADPRTYRRAVMWKSVSASPKNKRTSLTRLRLWLRPRALFDLCSLHSMLSSCRGLEHRNGQQPRHARCHLHDPTEDAKSPAHGVEDGIPHLGLLRLGLALRHG